MSLGVIVKFAKSKLGCGYVYGATGWTCSAARREQQANQYPQYADLILNTCAKWDGKQCYDCAQLTRYAVKAAGGNLPSGATSQWKNGPWVRKGTVDEMPDVPGLILYRENNGIMPHTGIYIGNGEVIDSRGSAYGVIQSKFSSYPWTHWGEPVVSASDDDQTDQEESNSMYDEYIVKASGGLRMREQPNGAYMRMVPDGTHLFVMEIKDNFGRIEYAGHIGYVSMNFLVRASDSDAVEEATPSDPNTTEESESVSDSESTRDTVVVEREKLLELYNYLGALLSESVD